MYLVFTRMPGESHRRGQFVVSVVVSFNLNALSVTSVARYYLPFCCCWYVSFLLFAFPSRFIVQSPRLCTHRVQQGKLTVGRTFCFGEENVMP